MFMYIVDIVGDCLWFVFIFWL